MFNFSSWFTKEHRLHKFTHVVFTKNATFRYDANLYRRVLVARRKLLNLNPSPKIERVNNSFICGALIVKDDQRLIVTEHYMQWRWGWYDIIRCYNPREDSAKYLLIRNRNSLSSEVKQVFDLSINNLSLANSGEAFAKYFMQDLVHDP